MRWRRLRSACLLALLVGCSIWFLAFLKTGLPGQFSSDALIHVRGSVPADEHFACITGAGALKVGLEPCGFFHFIWNHVTLAALYFFLSIVFGGSGVSSFSFWITFFVCFVVFYLLLARRDRENASRQT